MVSYASLILLLLLKVLMLLGLLAIQEILLAMNLLINVPNKVRVFGLPSKDLSGLDSPRPRVSSQQHIAALRPVRRFLLGGSSIHGTRIVDPNPLEDLGDLLGDIPIGEIVALLDEIVGVLVLRERVSEWVGLVGILGLLDGAFEEGDVEVGKVDDMDLGPDVEALPDLHRLSMLKRVGDLCRDLDRVLVSTTGPEAPDSGGCDDVGVDDSHQGWVDDLNIDHTMELRDLEGVELSHIVVVINRFTRKLAIGTIQQDTGTTGMDQDRTATALLQTRALGKTTNNSLDRGKMVGIGKVDNNIGVGGLVLDDGDVVERAQDGLDPLGSDELVGLILRADKGAEGVTAGGVFLLEKEVQKCGADVACSSQDENAECSHWF